MSDDTAAIQALINAAKPGDTVTIPAGRFMINGLVGADGFASGGIFLKSDMTLFLSFGAVLQAIPNISTHYAIVTLKGCTNTKVLGPGSITGDRDSRPSQDPGPGQWGFGISVWGGCKAIVVRGPTISKLWGDAISIIGASDMLVDQVTVDACRRQGMSLCDGDNIRFTNSTFKNAAMSDLDLEPFTNGQTVSNALVQYCNFTSDAGDPAHIGVGSSVGTYKNIVIKDCQYNLKMQPIFIHDNAGNLGTPWWAFLLNRIFYQGLHLPTYRFVGYPQSWSGP